jgi:hypothetical protein
MVELASTRAVCGDPWAAGTQGLGVHASDAAWA